MVKRTESISNEHIRVKLEITTGAVEAKMVEMVWSDKMVQQNIYIRKSQTEVQIEKQESYGGIMSTSHRKQRMTRWRTLT